MRAEKQIRKPSGTGEFSPSPGWDLPGFLEAVAYGMGKAKADGLIDRYRSKLLVDLEAGRAMVVPDALQ
jgi:hypothetical protein